jgi:NhaA family Na+:H+ antiporter
MEHMSQTRRARFLGFTIEHTLLLPAGAIVALVWANTFEESYARFALALGFVVNDVGMVLFFALLTKEVVEATTPGGVLHTWRRAALPVVAAVGAMIAPALIYIASVYAMYQTQLLRGWVIPCATDIAFGYPVARAIFRRHAAIPFLLLLALVDDVLGLVLLAALYPTRDLHLALGALLMAAALGVSLVLRRRGTRSVGPYLLAGGGLSWSALFWGGVHPALALVPIVPFLPHAPRDLGLFVEAPARAHDALSELERHFKYPVEAVLFFFALVNAGVKFGAIDDGTWVVLGALGAGKPLGIVGAVAIAVALGLHLPARLRWADVVVVGFVTSIGFTVALFFATAAFPPGGLLTQTKMGAILSVSGAALALAAAALLKVGRWHAES